MVKSVYTPHSRKSNLPRKIGLSVLLLCNLLWILICFTADKVLEVNADMKFILSGLGTYLIIQSLILLRTILHI